MAIYFTVLLVSLAFIHSTSGGLLRGLAYSAASVPVNYNYGRIASYSSPTITNPVGASYSTRYTAYTAVPLPVATPALVPRQASGGLARTFSAHSFSRSAGFHTPLIRQGISAYAAVPIAGYRASFRGPSIRSYGASLRSFPAAINVQELYSSPVGFDQYAEPLLNDHRSFGSFDNENQLSVW